MTVTRRSVLGAGSAAAALALLERAASAAEPKPPMTAPPNAPGRARLEGRIAVADLDSGRADGVRTGGARRVKVDGKYEVWTKQVGTGSVPVLTLHGGPGFSSDYLECFEDFLPANDVRYWYYDQLGCGNSDHPADRSLWTLERYTAEVEQVRSALGLDRFVLFGHSWGGMLAIEYALEFGQHLSGLVISDMTASIPQYVEHAKQLEAQLPPEILAKVQKIEAAGDYANPEYEELLMGTLYAEHVCRLDPWPEPLLRVFGKANLEIYNLMQGPSEFVVTGNLKSWDRFPDLAKIAVPTLLLVGAHDTMSVEQIREMGRRIPRSRVVVLENGSHLCMYDDQEAYFRALVPFLHEAHAGSFRA